MFDKIANWKTRNDPRKRVDDGDIENMARAYIACQNVLNDGYTSAWWDIEEGAEHEEDIMNFAMMFWRQQGWLFRMKDRFDVIGKIDEILLQEEVDEMSKALKGGARDGS
jgi:hypothetical protein